MILPQQRVCIRVQPSVECFEQLNIVVQIEIIREEGRVFSCLYIKTGADAYATFVDSAKTQSMIDSAVNGAQTTLQNNIDAVSTALIFYIVS